MRTMAPAEQKARLFPASLRDGLMPIAEANTIYPALKDSELPVSGCAAVGKQRSCSAATLACSDTGMSKVGPHGSEP